MWARDRESSGESPAPSHDGDSVDEAGIWEDEAISISELHGLVPSVQTNYSNGFTGNQGRAVNVPIVYPPTRPLSPPPDYTSDVSDNEPDPSPDDDPQVRREDQNYINSTFDLILKQYQELRLADIQLQNEIRTGLNSQSTMLSQSWGAVQKQLRQSRKYCEATMKKLENLESRCRDSNIDVHGEIKELRQLLVKKQKRDRRKRKRLRRNLRYCGNNEDSVQNS